MTLNFWYTFYHFLLPNEKKRGGVEGVDREKKKKRLTVPWPTS